MSGLFEFRSAAQQKKDDARYAARIFPRGAQVQEEIAAQLSSLCPKAKPKLLMMAFVSGKESVQRLRHAQERDMKRLPSAGEERTAALQGICPRRIQLSAEDTACVMALIFADLAADGGAPMAGLEELRASAEAEKAALPKL